MDAQPLSLRQRRDIQAVSADPARTSAPRRAGTSTWRGRRSRASRAARPQGRSRGAVLAGRASARPRRRAAAALLLLRVRVLRRGHAWRPTPPALPAARWRSSRRSRGRGERLLTLPRDRGGRPGTRRAGALCTARAVSRRGSSAVKVWPPIGHKEAYAGCYPWPSACAAA